MFLSFVAIIVYVNSSLARSMSHGPGRSPISGVGGFNTANDSEDSVRSGNFGKYYINFFFISAESSALLEYFPSVRVAFIFVGRMAGASIP